MRVDFDITTHKPMLGFELYAGYLNWVEFRYSQIQVGLNPNSSQHHSRSFLDIFESPQTEFFSFLNLSPINIVSEGMLEKKKKEGATQPFFFLFLFLFLFLTLRTLVFMFGNKWR